MIDKKKSELESLSVRGDLHITEYELVMDADGNQTRGEKIGEFEEKNIVLKQGISFILQAAASITNSGKTVSTIKIGNDVGGGGSILNPVMPNEEYTENNQTVVYTVPTEEFFIMYPDDYSVRFLCTIHGNNVMSFYPELPNIIYTSASIYTVEDKSVTYKRFPARTISSLISVDISWTISIHADCPI